MPFPFTFIFNVPGIINPFAADHPSQPEQPPPTTNNRIPRSQLPKINRRQLPPSSLDPPSSSSTLISRKRGWHPAFAEPSISTATLTSTSGYLYPPNRSGDCFWSQNPHDASNEFDQPDPHEGEELPPLKKRRGLAGTIISTAVSAALIGGAVGLTVYRLWRNRGKLQQQPAPEPVLDDLPPPPPYDAPSHYNRDFKVSQPAHLHASSPPPSAKKLRHPQTPRQNKRTATTQHRRKKSHRTHPDIHSLSSSLDPRSSTQPEFDFERESRTDEVEDKMDWMGDTLSMLIEQGKRALNTQVVVKSDAAEDEVDDGSDAWEEENDMRRSSPRQSRSRSGSVRHSNKRPRTLNFGPGPSTTTSSTTHHIHHTPSASSSPRFADFNFPVTSSAPTASFISGGGGGGFAGLPTASHSTTSLNRVSVEDSSTFESPELRESMERARQRLLTRRLGGT